MAATKTPTSQPISVRLKLALIRTMAEQRVTQAELARRIGMRPQQVSRIFNLEHNTKADTLELAFKALGKDLIIQIGDIESPRQESKRTDGGRELLAIRHIDHRATAFGNGVMGARIVVTGGVDVNINIYIRDIDGKLACDGGVVIDCVNGHEQPVDYVDADIEAWINAVWGSEGVLSEYKEAVNAANAERACNIL